MAHYVKYIGRPGIEIRKVGGAEARMLVEGGKWEHCSKKQYKAFKRFIKHK